MERSRSDLADSHLLGGGTRAAAALTPPAPGQEHCRHEKRLLALLSFPIATQPHIHLLGWSVAHVLPAGAAPDSEQVDSPTTDHPPLCSCRFSVGDRGLHPCQCREVSNWRHFCLPPKSHGCNPGTICRQAPLGAAGLQLQQVAPVPRCEPVASRFRVGTSKAASQGQMPKSPLPAAPAADPQKIPPWLGPPGPKGDHEELCYLR